MTQRNKFRSRSRLKTMAKILSLDFGPCASKCMGISIACWINGSVYGTIQQEIYIFHGKIRSGSDFPLNQSIDLRHENMQENYGYGISWYVGPSSDDSDDSILNPWYLPICWQEYIDTEQLGTRHM